MPEIENAISDLLCWIAVKIQAHNTLFIQCHWEKGLPNQFQLLYIFLVCSQIPPANNPTKVNKIVHMQVMYQ
jgi:hypothetical protein